MQDLKFLTTTGEYTKPSEITTNELLQAAQSYVTIFLTLIGSVPELPSYGTNFKIGQFTDELRLRKYNVDVFNIMGSAYGLKSTELKNISFVDDRLSMTIVLNKDTITIVI